MKRAYAYEVFLLLLYVACSLSIPSCSAKPSGQEPPRIFGIDPFPSAVVATGYYDILSAWMNAGYRNMTVIHVGPKDGLAFIPTERLETIRRSLKGGQARPDDRSMVNADNYLFAASRMGLIKRVVWVIPFGYLGYIDAEARTRSFLQTAASHFRTEDIDTMRLNNGIVSGRLFGIETEVCSPEKMFRAGEPALITIDTGFFPVLAAQKGMNKLGAMRDFFDTMSAWRIRARAVFIVSPPDLKAMHGYLSEQVQEIMKNPGIVRTNAPPAIWVIRDQAENMLSGGGVREAVSFLDTAMKKDRDDPYLIVMRETGRALLSDKSSALDALADLCVRRAAFCQGIVDAGVLLRDRGDPAGAGEFLERAMSLRPGLDSARFEYARTLYKSRKYAEAREALSLLSNPAYSVSAGLLLGDCAYALQREDEALVRYETALKSYREAGGYRLAGREQESLNRLKSIYEKRNDRRGLKVLEGIPLVE